MMKLTHRALHDDHVLGLPNVEHGHAGDDGVRVFDRGGVDGVVSSHNKADVRVLEVVCRYIREG